MMVSNATRRSPVTAHRIILFTVFLLLLVHMGQAQTKRYVKEGGTGNGTSWANASGNLQAMINASASGDQVWVAAGTYKPGTTRTDFFTMKEGVKVYGGFAPDGNPGLNERAPYAYKTILSGDINGDDVVTVNGNTITLANNSDNCYHVIINNGNGLTAAALLDGFIIAGGNANNPSGTIANFGGGMLNGNVAPTLQNLVFVGNTASTGGALSNGGSSVTLTNALFYGNTTSGNGGAIANLNASTPVITNVTFCNNQAFRGGGLFISGATPILKNCIFWHNQSDVDAQDVAIFAAGSLNISYSILQHGRSEYATGITPGQGVLYAVNPFFEDPYNGDFSLQASSCAVNAGSNSGPISNLTIDLLGNPRIYKAAVDMGAFECQVDKASFVPPFTTRNNSLSFDGQDDYVSIAPADQINCSNVTLNMPAEVTVEYWYKGTRLQSAFYLGSSDGYIFSGDSITGLNRHTIKTSAGTVSVAVGATATDGAWHHIAFTWKSNTTNGFKSYLDGQLVAQANTPNANLPYINPSVFLGSQNGRAPFLQGRLDEVRIWNTARSQTNIASNMFTTVDIQDPSLLMYYTFDQGFANDNNTGEDLLPNTTNTNLWLGSLVNFALSGNTSNWAAPAWKTIRYVSANGPSNGNGSAWGNESKNLQAMIDASYVEDEVWVKIGTYKPSGTGDPNASFRLKEGVKIYGGFDGFETNLLQRSDFNLTRTILSGDLNGDDATGNKSDNSLHVCMNDNNGLTPATILDRFVIKGGNNDGTGGGMYNINASPTLTNITFTDNNAALGGGIYNDNASPVLSKVNFTGNTALAGGGVYNINASPALQNVTITGNIAELGGGMFNDGGAPKLINVIFIQDSARLGGAIYNQTSSPTIINGLFSRNKSRENGAAMYNSGATPTILNTTFSLNAARNVGGACYNDNSTTTIRNSLFNSNTGGNRPDIFCNSGNVDIRYSLMQSVRSAYTTGFTVGAGMLYNIDPFLIDPANDDCRLQPTSCAIFTGNPADVSPDVNFDLLGFPRIRGSAYVSMGAYESRTSRSGAPATGSDNGLNFDGVDDFVRLAAIDANCAAVTFNPVSALTVEYWFRGSNPQSAVRFQNGSNYISAGWNSGNGFRHILSNSGGTDGVSMGSDVADGNWHHVAMTWQKGTVNGFKSYLDGVLVEQKNAANTNLPFFTTGMFLGSLNGTSEFTNGTLDEVRIWNVARTLAEIQANMLNQLTTPQTGLLMYYKMDHGTANGSNSSSNLLANSANTNYLGLLNNFGLNGTGSNWVDPKSLPTVRYVKQNATGTGTSWADASGDLQAMINASAAGEQVWVAAGTYKPSQNLSGSAATGLRSATFVVKDGVELFGGFAGIESNVKQRNIAANTTVLSGELQNNNCYHVVVAAAPATGGTGIVLDGFTISGGGANEAGTSGLNGVNITQNYGAGLYLANGTNTIVNNVFTGNFAISGGACYIDGGINTFTGNSFYNNTALLGSGMFIQKGTNTVVNNIVNNNLSSSGSVYLAAGNNSFVNNSLVGNSANNGAIVYCGTGNNDLVNNIAWGTDNGIVNISSNLTVTNCIVQGGYTGTGNTSADPLFVNAAAGNYRLQACSPAINAGNSAANSMAKDLDGNPRKVGTIDIGAYEYQGAAPPRDTLTTTVTICASQLPYVWNGNSYNSAGTYLARFTSANGCDSLTRLVLQLAAPAGFSAITSNINPICTNDVFTLTVNGVTGLTPTITWRTKPQSDPSGTLVGTGPSVQPPFMARTYYAAVQSACGDRKEDSIIITRKLSAAYDVVQPICSNGTGSLNNIIVSGGQSPYTISTSPTGTFAAVNNIAGLQPSTYRIYFRDAVGCTGFSDVVRIDRPLPLQASFTRNNATCFNATNGSISNLSTTNGQAPYTYTLSPTTAYQPVTAFSNLRAGNYRVYVNDGAGCKAFTDIINIAQPAAINITFTRQNVVCGNNRSGSITITGTTGGSGSGYRYSLSPSGPFQATTSFTNLQAGNYRIYCQDGNGCSTFTPVITIAPCTPTVRMAGGNAPIGIEPLAENTSQIFPNPTSGRFTLTYSSATAAEGSVTISNSVGQSLSTRSVRWMKGSNTLQFDLSNQPAGMYWLRITTKEGVAVKMVEKVR